MITTAIVLKSRYTIDALIDRGGMANVYRATDLRLEREVAVKVLRDLEHKRRFVAEARTLASLDHPNLVRVLDAGTHNGKAFLVLELLGGATVRELLRGGLLDSGRVARIGSEATAALDYIHRRGIVHRDVKPSNLMLDDYGSLRLADFGIARLMGATAITTSHQPIGTLPYIAPEQLESGDVGPPADIYSLGLVLIECLTGRRVFGGPPADAAAARLSRDPEVPAGLPGPWPRLLQTMTAREPEARPTAAAVHARLQGGTPAADVAAAPAPHTDATPTNLRPVQQARRTRRRRQWISALLLATLVAGASIAAVVAYRPPSHEHSSPRAAETPTTFAPTTTLSPTTLPPTTLPPTTLSPDDTFSDDNAGDPNAVPDVVHSNSGSQRTPGTSGTPGSPTRPGTPAGAALSRPAGPAPPVSGAPSRSPSPASPPPLPPTSPPPPPPPPTCLGLPLPLGIPCPISL
jgi:serine/threonine protein kinase